MQDFTPRQSTQCLDYRLRPRLSTGSSACFRRCAVPRHCRRQLRGARTLDATSRRSFVERRRAARDVSSTARLRLSTGRPYNLFVYHSATSPHDTCGLPHPLPGSSSSTIQSASARRNAHTGGSTTTVSGSGTTTPREPRFRRVRGGGLGGPISTSVRAAVLITADSSPSHERVAAECARHFRDADRGDPSSASHSPSRPAARETTRGSWAREGRLLLRPLASDGEKDRSDLRRSSPCTRRPRREALRSATHPILLAQNGSDAEDLRSRARDRPVTYNQSAATSHPRICLCLRWPTVADTSASWLHCLAAARPTVVSDLAHLVASPRAPPRAATVAGQAEPVAVRVICWTGIVSRLRCSGRGDRTHAPTSSCVAATVLSANHTRKWQRTTTASSHDAARYPANRHRLPSHFTEDFQTAWLSHRTAASRRTYGYCHEDTTFARSEKDLA